MSDEITLNEVDKLRQINKNKLDEEFIKQVDVYGKIGNMYIISQEELEYLEYELAKLTAKLTKKMQENFKSDKAVSRLTEGVIARKLLGYSAYRTLREELIKKKMGVKNWEIKKKMWEHRGRMLDRLTDLFIREYWSISSKPLRKYEERK